MLGVNLCIKSGLNTFSPPPRQVYLFKVTVYLYLGGGTKARICPTTVRKIIEKSVMGESLLSDSILDSILYEKFSILDSRFSILDERFSILDTRFSQESRIETRNRLSTYFWTVLYLDRFKMSLEAWSMVFLFQIWSKHTLVEPKMERKYATEYSSAEKWASEC